MTFRNNGIEVVLSQQMQANQLDFAAVETIPGLDFELGW